MPELINLPPQQLPFSKKNKAWRKKHLDWAEGKTLFNYNPVRTSVVHKKINYDLLNGKLHIGDLQLILNPNNIEAGYIPDNIQHFPIMNSKLNVLKGEESKRPFNYRVVITNHNAISMAEDRKKDSILSDLQRLVADNSISEEEYTRKLERINEFYNYEWQDIKEVRANALLNHYVKEYNIPLMFNEGIMDAMAVGEEIYQCDIVGGEPVVNKINTMKISVFRSGYSNKVEDADVIILEDYWSPGKVIDTYYDVLSTKDIKYIESLPDNLGQGPVDSMGQVDTRMGFINPIMVGDELGSEGFYFDPLNLFDTPTSYNLLPYDLNGNLRVIRMYWKSRRRIKKVKSYDIETGEEVYNFYPESYIIDESRGEEEFIFYINEAWEGTKIGADIYVNMRPRVIQYNRLSNPSRCHFGIIGSIYNLADSRPYSLVDMMKPYNYSYDVIHDRLNKVLERNWGKIVRIDIAKVPKGWDIEKWLYYAKTAGLAVEDSFKEGNTGVAKGKLAGGLNNASSGVIDAEAGNIIQQLVNLLEFIKLEMSEVVGITRQREGQISNRETVGGVERATLQSSHITEWIFIIHEDLKRRVLECFLETAKIALKGRSKKFQYIMSDGSLRVMDIDGDEFAEADYGLVVENNDDVVNSKLDMLAQAALQTQRLSFSTIMKLFSSVSLAEKQRFIERDEQNIQQREAQMAQQQQEANNNAIQAQLEQKQLEVGQKEEANIRDNEAKILIAQIQASSRDNDPEIKRETLLENMRQFDEKLKLSKEELELKRKSIENKTVNR